MSNVNFTVKEFKAKVDAASKTIPNIDQLRSNTVPAEGDAFMVARTLFIWVGADKTPDDGLDSVKPASVSAKAPGRYRRAGLAHPLVKN